MDAQFQIYRIIFILVPWILLNFLIFKLVPTTFYIYMPFATIVLAYLIHWLDDKYKWHGIRNIYNKKKQRLKEHGATERMYQIGKEVVSVSITKQAIFAALGSGILAFLLNSKLNTSANTSSLSTELVTFVAIFGLSIAILLTLISILCYDYSLRFNWDEDNTEELIRKGFYFDRLSFYSLTASLIFALAIVQPVLTLVINFLWGIGLWIYYFFDMYTFHRKLPNQPSSQSLN